MSDWEMVDEPQAQSQAGSDWEIATEPSPSQQQPVNESFGASAALAIPRIGEDLFKAGYDFIKNIPGYYQSSKTEVPGVLNVFRQHPVHALGQAVAGLADLGENVINLPSNLANYASKRLNLLPQNVAEKIPRLPDDMNQEINQTLGSPQYPGENLLRGIARNAPNIFAAGKVASIANPLNLTARSIAKDVLTTGKQQMEKHSKMYNKIWDKAESSGFNQVPIDEKLLSDNLNLIEKYKTPKEYQSLENFILEPTLQNAQKAQSDMGVMHRKLEEASRSRSLTSEERALYNAAIESENHIQKNMFKNRIGQINEDLQNQYNKVSRSYRDNVVPYKYNPSIQAYKNREMLAKELVKSLSGGEFAAKKGWSHPAIAIRNMFFPASVGSAGLGGAYYLYNQMMGTNPSNK